MNTPTSTARRGLKKSSDSFQNNLNVIFSKISKHDKKLKGFLFRNGLGKLFRAEVGGLLLKKHINPKNKKPTSAILSLQSQFPHRIHGLVSNEQFKYDCLKELGMSVTACVTGKHVQVVLCINTIPEN